MLRSRCTAICAGRGLVPNCTTLYSDPPCKSESTHLMTVVHRHHFVAALHLCLEPRCRSLHHVECSMLQQLIELRTLKMHSFEVLCAVQGTYGSPCHP